MNPGHSRWTLIPPRRSSQRLEPASPHLAASPALAADGGEQVHANPSYNRVWVSGRTSPALTDGLFFTCSGDSRWPVRDASLRVNALPTSPAVAHKRSEEHTSELQSQSNLVCRLLLEKKK